MRSLLFTNFNLICAVWIGGLCSWGLHIKLARHVAAGRLDETEERRFVKGFAIGVSSLFIAFWLLQLSAGPALSPQFMAWPAPQKWIGTSIYVLYWVAFLWWIWLAGGAQFLSRLFSLSESRLWASLGSSTGIKAFSLLVIAVVLWSFYYADLPS